MSGDYYGGLSDSPMRIKVGSLKRAKFLGSAEKAIQEEERSALNLRTTPAFVNHSRLEQDGWDWVCRTCGRRSMLLSMMGTCDSSRAEETWIDARIESVEGPGPDPEAGSSFDKVESLTGTVALGGHFWVRDGTLWLMAEKHDKDGEKYAALLNPLTVNRDAYDETERQDPGRMPIHPYTVLVQTTMTLTEEGSERLRHDSVLRATAVAATNIHARYFFNDNGLLRVTEPVASYLPKSIVNYTAATRIYW